MAITNYDGIIASRAAGKYEDPIWFKSTNITPTAAGNWLSLLRSAGSPAAITASGGNNGAIMTNTNTGALPIKAPTGGDGKYFLTGGVSVPSVTGFSALLLIDVVWLANYATSASPGNITMPTLTRYTDGKGLQIGCAVSTTLGAFTPTVTVTYNPATGDSGTGHTTNTGAFASALASPKMMPLLTPSLPLASGDTGVTSITNVTISATNATGALDVFLYKPIMMIPTVAANTYVERDSTIQIDGLTQLPVGTDNLTSCLCWLALSGGTSACATQMGQIRTVSG